MKIRVGNVIYMAMREGVALAVLKHLSFANDAQIDKVITQITDSAWQKMQHVIDFDYDEDEDREEEGNPIGFRQTDAQGEMLTRPTDFDTLDDD